MFYFILFQFRQLSCILHFNPSMSQISRPVLRATKKLFTQIKTSSNFVKIQKPLLVSTRNFSGPLEPPDTRRPEDVEPDFWDARHWEWLVECIEYEVKHYDPEFSILPLNDLEYDLKFAKKMYEWRSLMPNKYIPQEEQAEVGQIDSVFGAAGYKLRADIDHRIIGGRGGVDSKENFYNDYYLYGPFGTEENPVLVPSYNRFRFIGCIGGYDGKPEHELAWFVVRQGPKHRCPLCGQIFQLWTTDSSHADHPYHDSSRDYEKELLNMIHDHQDAFGGFFPHHEHHHDHGHGHDSHSHDSHSHDKKGHGHDHAQAKKGHH